MTPKKQHLPETTGLIHVMIQRLDCMFRTGTSSNQTESQDGGGEIDTKSQL